MKSSIMTTTKNIIKATNKNIKTLNRILLRNLKKTIKKI